MLCGVVGLACAVAACGSDARSRAASRLHGNVKAVHVPVVLVPQFEPGHAGWVATFTWALLEGGERSGGELFYARRPMMSKSWGTEGPPMITYGMAIVEPRVTAVAVDRLVVPVDPRHPKFTPVPGVGVLPTYGEPGLLGLRVVAVEILGAPKTVRGRVDGPLFLPLDSKGHVIPFGPVPPSPESSVEPVVNSHGELPEKGHLCHVGSRSGGARPFASQVVTALKPQLDIFGGGFISCARAEYKVGGGTVVAVVLVDARMPGVRPPGLPGMRPVPGHAGVFDSPGLEGQVLARRIKGGWLVVEGHTLKQREEIFDQVEGTVHVRRQ